MNSIIMNNTALDAKEHDRLVGITVQRMRHSLGVSAGELARASGIPCPGIEAIERGGPATRSERHDIMAALGWLSNNRVARGPTAAGRGCVVTISSCRADDCQECEVNGGTPGAARV